MRGFVVIAVLSLAFAPSAQAHFQLMMPPAVTADANGKGSPPCGPDTGMAATPTAIQGGHPLNIKVFETVGHKGFYRIALALKSRSELPVDNVVYDAAGKVLPPNGTGAGDSARADTEKPAAFPVLADDFYHHEIAVDRMVYDTDSVNIPNVNCDRCTLQVIEFMYPHAFNRSNPPPGGGYFYHHCAELKITADPALPMFGADGGAADASTADAGGGTTTGAGGTVAMDAAQPGSGGTSGTGGQSGSGGSSSTGAGAGSGGMSGSGATTSSSSSGGCAIAAGPTMALGSLAAFALAVAGSRRRRR